MFMSNEYSAIEESRVSNITGKPLAAIAGNASGWLIRSELG